MVTALDLNFLGRPGAIAAGLIDGPDGLALVDPGPGELPRRPAGVAGRATGIASKTSTRYS